MGQIKSFARDVAKAFWRGKVREFIERHLPGKNDAHVVCFPGAEMREVFEVYDALSVRRKNILGVEQDSAQHDALQAHNASLEQRIRLFHGSALELAAQPATEQFSIISLDYCGYLDNEKISTLRGFIEHEWLSPTVVLVTNYLKAREASVIKQMLKTTAPLVHVAMQLSAEQNDVLTNAGNHTFSGIVSRLLRREDASLAHDRDVVAQFAPISLFHSGGGPGGNKFIRAWFESLKVKPTGHAEMRELLYSTAINNPYFLMLQDSCARRFDCAAHEAFEYVSDSGHPMISDCYVFRHIPHPLAHLLHRALKYEFQHGALNVTVTNDAALAKAERQFAPYAKEHQRALRTMYEGLPLQRTILRPKTVNPEEDIVQPARRRELRRISALDHSEMEEYLSAGFTSTEVAALYDGKYTPMQVAGVKAMMTRNNGRS